jgi:hypothetical protein
MTTITPQRRKVRYTPTPNQPAFWPMRTAMTSISVSRRLYDTWTWSLIGCKGKKKSQERKILKNMWTMLRAAHNSVSKDN